MAATCVWLNTQPGDLSLRHSRRTGKVVADRAVYAVGVAPACMLSSQPWKVEAGPAAMPAMAAASRDPAAGLTFNLRRSASEEVTRAGLLLPYEHAAAVPVRRCNLIPSRCVLRMCNMAFRQMAYDDEADPDDDLDL